MITISFETKIVDSLIRAAQALEGHASTALDNMERWTLEAVKKRTPIGKPDYFGRNNPGALRDSLHFTGAGLRRELFGNFYGRYVLGGTKSHVIAAKDKPFLVFYHNKAGHVVRLKKVNHPGTKPNDFRQGAIAEQKEALKKAASMVGNRVMEMIRA